LTFLTLYILFFITEKDVDQVSKEHGEVNEPEFNISETLSILFDILKNPNVQTLFMCRILVKLSSSIVDNVSGVYLTNDLGFAKETFSLIHTISFPL